jgi:glyceraldehyde 3-phosphate dehydrogenase
MAIRVDINGFGRRGRLALRAGWGRADVDFVYVNEIAGGTATAGHRLTFDSVHGRWNRRVEAGDDHLTIDGTCVSLSARCGPRPGVPGKFRTRERLDQ